LPFPEVEAAVRRALEGQSSAGTWHAHGIPFDCRFAPTYDVGGRVVGSSIVAFDVAAQRDEERSGRGREAADAMARLSAVVAHSLNDALAVIQCHSDLAHAEVGHDGAADQHLNAIDGAARDAGDLVAQLRAAAGAPVAQPEHVELTALLAEASDALRSRLRVSLHASAVVPVGIAVIAHSKSLLEAITRLGQWMQEGGASALRLELWSGSVDEDEARWLGLAKPGRYARVTLRSLDQPMAEEPVVGPEPFCLLGDGAQPSLCLLSADGLLRGNGARLRVLDGMGAQIYLPLSS
jgi:signal transduction histidine kinase